MKIVIIEDHQLVRDLLVASCGQLVPGADVAGASTGAEGVALCGELQPDLVLLDLVDGHLVVHKTPGRMLPILPSFGLDWEF